MGPYALPFDRRGAVRRLCPGPPGPTKLPARLRNYFNYRKLSIFGGSNEIQKNIISKMILGL
jgi:alkylation response protein AidB-like acyl-CoA dehydrogenase